MQKSYNDITAQAERCVELNRSLLLFTTCRGGADDSAIWQIAARTRAQHGISRLCKDRYTKYPRIRPYEVRCVNRVPWWETKEWREGVELAERHFEERAKKYARKKEERDPCKGMSVAERIEWCVCRMHASTVEENRVLILDMLKRSISFGVEAQRFGKDALQLVKLVHSDTRHILSRYKETHPNKDIYQLQLL